MTETQICVASPAHRTPKASRHRSLSVSLVARSHNRGLFTLQGLPSEVIITIIEAALSVAKPRVLAVLSRAIHGLVNDVLYRTVILSSSTPILRLHRTATSSPHLASQIKKLVVTCHGFNNSHGSLNQQVRGIIAACRNLHILSLSNLVAIPNLTQHSQLKEITSPCFSAEESTHNFASCADTITHLRFTEPNECSWMSPCEMLSRFGNPKNLSHLQVARRTGANEANDIAFVQDLEEILATYSKIEMVVVSVFQGYSWSSTDASGVEESHAWKLFAELREADGRVVLLKGTRDEWEKEVEDVHPADSIDSRFWQSCVVTP